MLHKAASRVLLVVTLCVALISISPCYAYDVQEWITNTMPVDAWDLTKIVVGQGVVTGAITNRFGPPTITDFSACGGSVSIIHWGPNGQPLHPGEGTWGCYNTTGPAQTAMALWTDEDGNFIGIAAVEIRANHTFDHASGATIIEFEHTWRQWMGQHFPPDPGDWFGDSMGPIIGTEVYYGLADHVRPLEELNLALFDNGEIEWVPLEDFFLNSLGDTSTYVLDPDVVPAGGVVLLRVVLTSEEHGLQTTTIYQFENMPD
jgi:hypothetical protein